MNKQIRFIRFNGLIIATVCLFAFTSAFASVGEKNNSLIVKNLSKKLQNDLALKSVTVQLKNVEEYRISKSEIGFKGDAVCILEDKNNQLPITFDAKLDAANQSLTDIVYDFVEPVSEFAPSSNEEILMKELMKKISKDYKTDNIVIAVDGVENVSNVNNEKEFTGIGEVRIGDLVWNKVKFDVVLDVKNKLATKVIYQLEK